MTITEEQLDVWFAHNSRARDDQFKRYTELRWAARKLAETIVRITVASADQTAAVRKVREALMTANAAIACEPDPE